MKKIFLILILPVFVINFSFAQSPIYTTAGYGANYGINGAYLGWNISGGGGETNFVNNIGGGNIGGFTFDNISINNVVTHLMNILANGNVGIGTTSPQNKFVVSNGIAGIEINPNATISNAIGAYIASYNRSTSAYADIIFDQGGAYTVLKANGNVGIGTTTPSAALQIGNFNSGSSNNQLLIPGVYNFEQIKLGQIGNGNSALEFVNHNSLTNSYGVKLLVDVDQVPGLQFQYATSATSYASLNYATGLYMNLSGNVGIGTTAPGTYRLAVNGGIHSQSVNVDLTGWSDYVFNQDYKLPSLAEVKSYIDQNHHLPDMPSEQEVIKDGINLGEMNRLLTKKVEELALYLIDKDKQVEQLQNEVKQLKQDEEARIAALEAVMAKLTINK